MEKIITLQNVNYTEGDNDCLLFLLRHLISFQIKTIPVFRFPFPFSRETLSSDGKQPPVSAGRAGQSAHTNLSLSLSCPHG